MFVAVFRRSYPFKSNFLRKIYICCFVLLSLTVYGHQVRAASTCAIATAHPDATAAGCEILRNGGNAFDAAIAVTAALAVVEPYSSGLGGGGFYLLHLAESEKKVFIDAREVAPQAASEKIYLDESGEVVPGLSREGPLAAAIPGIPSAISHLSKYYARLPLTDTLRPAISLAKEGFLVDPRFVRAVGWVEKRIRKFPITENIFFNASEAFGLGDILKQPDLGRTLEILSRDIDSFYVGEIAQEMVDFVIDAGGNWTLSDLAGYKVQEREPVSIDFYGSKIITAPLPSSGGLVMAQVFNILSEISFFEQSADIKAHLVIEAMRRGYNDRARFMGDPDFNDIKTNVLLSPEYARIRAKSIELHSATDSLALPSVFDLDIEGEETTHFSIIDDSGNRVAATLSINGPFGSGMVAGDTGVLLNNHMDDFSIGIGKGNAYDLVGNRVNGIKPGKRPLSSMSPTFVESEEGVLVLGTPGGSRIISMVILSVLEHLSNLGSDPKNIVALPRYHHQYLPDRVQIEPESFDQSWISSLEALGHKVQVYRRKWGNMQAIYCDKYTYKCVTLNDPRGKAGVVF